MTVRKRLIVAFLGFSVFTQLVCPHAMLSQTTGTGRSEGVPPADLSPASVMADLLRSDPYRAFETSKTDPRKTEAGKGAPARASALQGQAPEGDYGDAPDGSIAGYEDPYQGVIGRFPTRYFTTNSRVGRPGAHALVTGQEMLGNSVTREVDVTDPNDPDGTGNLVDEDRGDDGLRIGFDPSDPSTPKTIDIVVTVASGAPAVTRYVNVLADLNHDGVWQQFGTTEEWIIKNQATNIAPGSQGVAAQIPFDLIVNASPIWIRVVLSRDPINESDFAGVGGWDGSGEFAYGEVEDHFLPVAKAIASAFASARAAAVACSASSAWAAALAQAAAAAQANVTAIAAAFAQAQASATAAAVAAAQAQASAQAAAAASAQASASAQQAMSLSVSIPCATLSVSMQASAQASASAAAAAFAVAQAQAQAAAAAVATAQAKATAISVALANAQAAAAAVATASASAAAGASACAAASASASASAQSAALAIALGGRLAYAAAVARAVATAQAWATAQAHSQAIATAFVNVQVFVQVSVTAIAVAAAAAEAAATAAAAAQASAAAAANAAAAASASASASASVLGSAQAVFDPNCNNQLCSCLSSGSQVASSVTAKGGAAFTVALATLTATPTATSVRGQGAAAPAPGSGTKYILVKAPGGINVTIDPNTGQLSGSVTTGVAVGTYHVTAVAMNTCATAHYDVAVNVTQ
jgi:hypothetical protein